ncbi:MAG: DUF1302 domain-containing protein [Oleiphilaceae bacterium]|nr:DUF1302 domain-containing protein [Oleiphilaceae bacterium]
MTTTSKSRNFACRLPLAVALAAGVALPAHATISFNLFGFETDVEARLSAGTAVRVAEQDKGLIGQGNLGPEFAFTNQGASSTNFDDGNLNFERGDAYSTVASGRLDLFTQYRPSRGNISRFGGFLRSRYSYDFTLRKEDFATDPVGQRRELTEQGHDNAAEGEFLDAYVFVDGFVADMPFGVRYGRQVLNWGESTFIQNGINTTSPIDAQAFRQPGAELKDVLIPVEMLYGNITRGDLTLEAFLQTKWEPFEIDDCGTYFSTADVASDGCGPILLAGQVPDSQAIEEGIFAGREADKQPADKGQYGIAARYFSVALDGELGFYYQKLHSRLPILGVRFNNPSDDPNGEFTTNDAPNTALPSYFLEYPEDIDQFGISYSSTLPDGTSIGAEYSFKKDVPLQINTTDLLTSAAQVRDPNGNILGKFEKNLREENPGENFAARQVSGFKLKDVSQIQSTLIYFKDRTMGADRFIVVAEVGATYVHDLPDQSELDFGKSGIYGPSNRFIEGDNFTGNFCEEGPDGPGRGSNINPSYCSDDGFTTSFSWGYRTLFAWQYNNAFMGANLTPQVFFSHDVKGFAPDPFPNFQEGNKQVGLTLAADFLDKYSAEISYSNFFDGKFNTVNDRDFVGANIAVNF